MNLLLGKMYIIIIVVVVTVPLISCDCQRHGSGDAGVICSECRTSSPNGSLCADSSQVCDLEYELYAKFVQGFSKRAVFRDRTSEDHYYWSLAFVQMSHGVPEASCETYDAFKSLLAAGKTYGLDRKFPIEITYSLMSEEDFSTLVKEKGWPYVRENFGCKYSFTRVGFNKAKDEALFGRTIYCDSGWGRVETVLYRKVDGVWKEIRVITHGTA